MDRPRLTPYRGTGGRSALAAYRGGVIPEDFGVVVIVEGGPLALLTPDLVEWPS